MELQNGYTIASIGLLFCVFIYKLVSLIYQPQEKRLNLPPSPPALPVIGHLLLLGSLPHQSLAKLARKYGPIMYLKLGSVPTVVVCNDSFAKECLKTHDAVFASRPKLMVVKILFDNYKDIAGADYGPYWRKMRKMCHLELFSPQRMESTKHIREEEVYRMVKCMSEESEAGCPIDVRSHVTSLSRSIIARMMLNRNYFSSYGKKGSDFDAIVVECFHLIGVLNVGECLPFLRFLDIQGYERRMKAVKKRMDAAMEEIIRDHEVKSTQDCSLPTDATQDFVDILLSISKSEEYNDLNRENFRALIFDMLSAGTESSAVTIEWALSEVLLYPHVQQKAQQELDQVVGRNRQVTEDDLPNLEYLQCIVKETFRLHPAGPLMVPHESTEAVKVGGYDIPAKTRLLVDVWAIQRDPSTWERAEEFDPERFVGSGVDFRGQDFQLIPFGSGRRSCPGLNLGVNTVQLGLATLLHSFQWLLPSSELDMSEQFGLTLPRRVPLHAIAKPRLPRNIYHDQLY